MKYVSVCSGIEAATVAWHPLGWEPLWFSEVEPFCCALLKHYYGDVPNLGDMTKITEQDVERFPQADVLVGGTPCQSFSVAGLRSGLDDPRGNLALRFCQLASVLRPTWVLWENVPGVLSSWSGEPEDAITDDEWTETADFDTFTSALLECGYHLAYRILDAQYFGVPQRRRRVFVVGHLGDWRRAATVLLEREALSGHPPPSREAGAVVARPIAHGSTSDHCDESQQTYVVGPLQSHSKEHGHAMTTQQAVEAGQVIPVLEAGARQGHRDTSRDGIGVGEAGDPMFTLQSGKQHAIAFDTTQITSPGNYSNPKPGDACHPLAKGQHPPAIAYRTSGNSGVMEQGDKTAALNCGTDPAQNIIAYQCHGSNVGEMGHLRAGNGNATGGVPFVEQNMAVRRLTPRECERLQGFSDDWTKIPYRNKPAEQCPDGPRYRALGNSMAVPVMRWIGERILSE